jgi:transposase
MIALKQASRDDLVRLVVAQRETIQRHARVIAAQREHIAALEATVMQWTACVDTLLVTVDARRGDDGTGSGRARGMPGFKPATKKARPTKQPRKGCAQAFVRRRAEPTHRVVHACDHCPTCGLALTGGSVKRTREVIEVPLMPAAVTAHLYLERCCPHCHMRHTPAVELAGQVVGRQRFGVGLVSLIASLREEARLPVATIQRYLATFHGLSVSAGAIVGMLRQVAQMGTQAVTAIRAAIRGSPAVHADETGWREDGVNGYVWPFCTPTTRYFVRGSRVGTIVDAVLGRSSAAYW